jgi:hypothetical protein
MGQSSLHTPQILSTPILFLIFNRPDVTKLAFNKIREVKPKQLYLAADGPRKHKEGEIDLCKQARDIVLNNIDWDCEIKTLIREENFGCKKAVSSAISWFFENVPEGIILEDDILPDTSFFFFCEGLLKKYRDDERIMTISGVNFLHEWSNNDESYFFGHGGVWGWATWRRAWAKYDLNIQDWSDVNLKSLINHAIGSNEWFDYYQKLLDDTYSGNLDAWGIQWLYTVWVNGGLAINPAVNLIKNIGFGADASRTHDTNSPAAKLQSQTIKFPLKHPKYFVLNVLYLKAIADLIIPKRKKIAFSQRIYRRVKRLIK